MEKSKLDLLKKAGWKVGSVDEFLDSYAIKAQFELKSKLVKLLLSVREKDNVTQKDLALLLKTSQSRISKLENLHESVSIDLTLKALFSLGVTFKQIAQAIK